MNDKARREERERLEKAGAGMRSVLRPIFDYILLPSTRYQEVKRAMKEWDDATIAFRHVVCPPASAPEGTGGETK